MTAFQIARRVVLGTLFIGASALAQDVVLDAPLEEAPPPCQFRDRPCSAFPHLTLAIDVGGGAFEEGQPFGFGAGTGSGTSPGPAWGFRVGVELMSWLAIDAHYMGASSLINKDYSPAGPARLVTNAALAEIRLTLPLRYVQPYIFGGFGVYSTTVSGNTHQARNGTEFQASTEPGAPMGFGISIPITERLNLGAEATYHFFIGEKFSYNEELEGGDVTTFNAVLRMRL